MIWYFVFCAVVYCFNMVNGLCAAVYVKKRGYVSTITKMEKNLARIKNILMALTPIVNVLSLLASIITLFFISESVYEQALERMIENEDVVEKEYADVM